MVIPNGEGVLLMPVKVHPSPNKKQFYIDINHQGESRTLTQWNNQKFFSEDVATFIYNMIMTQILNGTFRWDYWFPRLRQEYLLEEIYFKYVDATPKRPATIKNIQRKWKHFKHMAKLDCRELSSLDFQWIRDKHGDTPKAKSIRQTAQAVLNWFHRQYGTDKRVDLIPIKAPATETPYLAPEVRWAIHDEMQEPYRDPCLIGIEMGLRINEICALWWDAVDWDGQGINVIRSISDYQLMEHPKQGKNQWFPMSDRVQDMLLRLKAQRDSINGFVFVHPSGKQIWSQQLSTEWKRACRVLGVPSAKFHHLRHAFLRDLAEAGASVKEAGALAGHRHLSTTERYIGTFSKTKLREIATLRKPPKQACN